MACKPATGPGFDPEACWTRVAVEGRLPSRITGTTMEVKALPAGAYRVRWVDTRQGDVISEEKLPLPAGLLGVVVYNFDRDIACGVSP